MRSASSCPSQLRAPLPSRGRSCSGDSLRAVSGSHVGRGLCHEALKRLDDSNDAVRLAGCTALSALAAASQPPAVETWRGTIVEYAVGTLVLRLDDPPSRCGQRAQ